MGLYDTIRCERSLPDGFDGELQTKDLGRSMVEHVITVDGRLMIADGFLSQQGELRHAADFNGVVNFYGSRYKTEDGSIYHGRGGVLVQGDKCTGSNGERLKLEWHEYDAAFEKGRLVDIRLVPES